MDTKSSVRGFREIAHTADWALEVWAPTREELFACAVEGMYRLMDLQPGEQSPEQLELLINGFDNETLLVSFLGELLYLLEEEGSMLLQPELVFQPGRLNVRGQKASAKGGYKEIKAVTYYHLAVQQDAHGWRVTITFDV